MALAGGVSIPLPQPLGYLYVPGMILARRTLSRSSMPLPAVPFPVPALALFC